MAITDTGFGWHEVFARDGTEPPPPIEPPDPVPPPVEPPPEPQPPEEPTIPMKDAQKVIDLAENIQGRSTRRKTRTWRENENSTPEEPLGDHGNVMAWAAEIKRRMAPYAKL